MAQSPRIRVAAPAESIGSSFGDLAVEFAADYGLQADEWQEGVVTDWLSCDAVSGRWAHMACGLSVPRQNGKNAALEIFELFVTVALGLRVLHTAHEVKTAQKHFRRLKYFFGSKVDDEGAKFPELNALVKEIRNVNGQEAIFLHNGGSIEIVARSKNSARGFTVDILVIDEAQELDDESLEALIPTTSSAPSRNPMWIYTGTPPGPKAKGEVFSRVRDETLVGAARQCWHEWSARGEDDPGGPDDVNDPQVWIDTNPGTESGRLLMDVIEGERTNLSLLGFMRERLGMWMKTAKNGVIPAAPWKKQSDEDSQPVSEWALGVEAGPDLAWASVAVSGKRADGKWHVALEANRDTHGDGVEWVVPYIEALVKSNPQIKSVWVDPFGPISAMLSQRAPRQPFVFTGTRIRVASIRAADLGATCANFLSGIVTGDIFHLGQSELTTAALAAGKRALADSGLWVWHRKSATSDITPVQAATLALHGAQTTKRVRSPLGRSTNSSRKAVVL